MTKVAVMPLVVMVVMRVMLGVLLIEFMAITVTEIAMLMVKIRL